MSKEGSRRLLLEHLRAGMGDPEADHSRAETLLVEWLMTFDAEVGIAWTEAQEQQDWWWA